MVETVDFLFPVNARVSKLARCRPGGSWVSLDAVLSLDSEDSVWNGNNPESAGSVEIWDPVDMPSAFLTSGGGKLVSSVCPSDIWGD